MIKLRHDFTRQNKVALQSKPIQNCLVTKELTIWTTNLSFYFCVNWIKRKHYKLMTDNKVFFDHLLRRLSNRRTTLEINIIECVFTTIRHIFPCGLWMHDRLFYLMYNENHKKIHKKRITFINKASTYMIEI